MDGTMPRAGVVGECESMVAISASMRAVQGQSVDVKQSVLDDENAMGGEQNKGGIGACRREAVVV